MKFTLSILLFIIFTGISRGEENKEVIIYDVDSLSSYKKMPVEVGIRNDIKKHAVPNSLFEKAINEAINVFGNSMRGTCAKEMETNITVTLEGKWAVVGVSVTGGIKIVILNPDISKNCGIQK